MRINSMGRLITSAAIAAAAMASTYYPTDKYGVIDYLYCVIKYGILPTSSTIHGDLSWEADWKGDLSATPKR